MPISSFEKTGISLSEVTFKNLPDIGILWYWKNLVLNSEIIIDDIEVIVDNKGDSIFGEVTNIKRVTMKFLNKSSGVTVNGDRSAEKLTQSWRKAI
jgi:hypothetical protein